MQCRLAPAPGQEFLGHRVAVVVGQDVVLRDTLRPQEALDQVGLFADRIAMARRLGGQAEPQQVECEHPPPGHERSPQRGEIPGGRGKAVDQHQYRRPRIATAADEEVMAPVGERSAPAAPEFEGVGHGSTMPPSAA